MEASAPPRKTCDKCYLRKIKCDRRQPRCSHCISYDTECTYTAPSRPFRPRPRARKQTATTNTPETHSGTADLHTFVQRLQAQVDELTRRLDNDGESSTTLQQPEQQPPAAFIVPPPTRSMPVALSALESAENTDYLWLGTSPATMVLPPIHQVMPIVRVFLDTFNSVMPLFQAKALLKLVNDWYAIPYQRDPVSWAAINVVLALTYKQNLTGNAGFAGGEDLAAFHLNKAQSVISEVNLGDTALLNVQVLVAMTMLLQASKNLKPSLILIATAMRLAHDLGLHTRAAMLHLDRDVARQHSYVFWIAYILDKDLSMRARQPSIQRDDDIDIDIPTPSRDGGDNLGVVTTLTGDVTMNYLLTRVQLAIIQGGIYDYLYSARSQNRSALERAAALESLIHALEEWKLSIPPEFGMTLAPKALSPASLSLLCVLHATSFACITMVNKAHAWNEQWLQSLRDSCKQSTQLRLPSRWKPLVHDARDFVALFEMVPPRGYGLIWETTCSYLTAATLVAANNASLPFDDRFPTDTRLINNAVKFIDDLTSRGRIAGLEQLQMVRNTCVDLNRSALEKRDETVAIWLRNDSTTF